MQARHENNKTQGGAQGQAASQTSVSEARLAAVVQAAYILEARTR